MSSTTYIRAMAYNNAWANHRLLAACGSLTAEALNQERTSFFPTIMTTLNHILIVDWLYVSALEGNPAGIGSEMPCPLFIDLAREQSLVDRRLIAVTENLSESELESIIHIQRRTHLQPEHTDRTLFHLFQHQTHHRGQVHAMLSGTDVAPPQLDEFFLSDEKEQAIRRDDFARLGFTEAQIWRKP